MFIQRISFAFLALIAFSEVACSDPKPMNPSNHSVPETMAPQPVVPPGAEVVTLGAGCFWCTEAVFQQQPGVLSVTSGYMGGTVANPTYDDICTGATGHAEVTRIVFDPKKTNLEKLLEVFWHAHDPTSLNRQGNDSGTQYRSVIFYSKEEQKQIAEHSKAELAKTLRDPVVTEIVHEGPFWPAENYHQDYYRLNKNRNPYCRLIIAPKLKKLGIQN